MDEQTRDLTLITGARLTFVAVLDRMQKMEQAEPDPQVRWRRLRGAASHALMQPGEQLLTMLRRVQ